MNFGVLLQFFPFFVSFMMQNNLDLFHTKYVLISRHETMEFLILLQLIWFKSSFDVVATKDVKIFFFFIVSFFPNLRFSGENTFGLLI